MGAVGRRRNRLTAGLLSLTMVSCLPAIAKAEPQQALAILLRELHAKPLGLYDGVRLFRINLHGGSTLTLTVSCEREQWRVQSGDQAFFDSPFLSAEGIARTWVCTEPARVLE